MSENMTLGKKALINIMGTRIQKRKLDADTHMQASVAKEKLLAQRKKDDLPRAEYPMKSPTSIIAFIK